MIENTAPERPPRHIDIVIHENKNENKEASCTYIRNSNHPNSDCHLWSGAECSDRDYYELKELRLEAQKNINENNINKNNSEVILPCDFEDNIKIVLMLKNTSRDDKLFNNSTLLDLLKFDIKELVNKKIEEYCTSKDDSVEQDNSLSKKVELAIYFRR